MLTRSIGLGLVSLGVAVLTALCCSTPVTATESPPPLPQAAAAENGVSLEHRVDAFVRAITRSAGMSDGDSPVRWNTPICLLAVGLAAEDSRIMADRLSLISTSVGAPLARAPCRPNFIVVATSEPDEVLKEWYARDKRLFGDATSAQIHQFLKTSQSRPVRVWYNIDWGRKSGTRNGHFVPSNARAESSAFVGNPIFDFFSIFAIIDTHRTEHTAVDRLADYVAMVGLTNVDLDVDLGDAPSILRLFAPFTDRQPPGLSRWDTAFLKALYQSDQTSRARRLDIEERVMHDIAISPQRH
jgi:hypothetical protein